MIGEELTANLNLYQILVSGKRNMGDYNVEHKDYEKLYVLYYSSVRDFIKKYVYSSSLAEDLTQEVFIKIWNNRDRLSEVQFLKTYIFTIAKNHTFTALKTIRRSKEALDNMMSEGGVQQSFVEDGIQLKEYNAFIEETLAKIPLRSRAIFKLCREEGKSYSEAADRMGISTNAIKNHMVGTMKVLKNAVEERFDISLSVLLFFLFK